MSPANPGGRASVYGFLFLSIFVSGVFLNVEIARIFRKGVGFTIGMILVPFIFWPILGFGDSRYATLKKKKKKRVVTVEDEE
jgi:hypothetical protein